MTEQVLVSLLSGGDLRSIARSNAVVDRVHTQADFDMLYALLERGERLLAMRAADAVEKITVTKPEFLAKHVKSILQLLENAQHKELKWHLALLAPRLNLDRSERDHVMKVLLAWLQNADESVIVRVNSLQALYDMGYSRDVLFLSNAQTPAAVCARIKKLAARST